MEKGGYYNYVPDEQVRLQAWYEHYIRLGCNHWKAKNCVRKYRMNSIMWPPEPPQEKT